MKRTLEKYLSYQTVTDSFNDLSQDETLAVICGDKSISYKEVVAKAKKIALAMQEKGVGKGDRVMLSMSYSVDFVCGFMAILYAGAAYVSIDRNWPADRLRFIYDDSGAVMNLTDECFSELSGTEPSGILPKIKPSDAFAIYYTSGSTGNPKGAMIHHQMLHYIVQPVPENVSYYETYKACERIFSMGNFAYEAILGDFLFTLYCGKTLILATDLERQDPALLGACMKRHGADGTMGTPSMLLRYLDDSDFSLAFSRLKRVFLIGEAVSVRDADQILDSTEAVVFDAYGTSEVGFFAYCRVRRGQPVELEYPTFGAKLMVIDEEGKQVEEGESGELCVGGVLAEYSLYAGLPGLTEQKYTKTLEYGRLYHTGDSAVLEHGGRIRMAGRLDGMQKLHGQRLEPREIEMVMEGFENIRQAAVAVRGEGKDAILCAWYTVKAPVQENDLRKYLGDRLPGYMIPSRMLRMDELPLNTSGKLDRRALPDIGDRTEAYEAPENELERILCSSFQDILKLDEPVGRNDNFFLLGGDSIQGMRLSSMLWHRIGLRYSPRMIFKYPSPALLASQQPEEDIITEPESGDAAYGHGIPGEIKSIASERDAEAVLPASIHTGSYLFMQKAGVSGAQNIQKLKVVLCFSLSEEEFGNRIHELTRIHPALRSSFAMDHNGKYWQIINKQWKPVTWYKDLCHLSPEAAERFISGFWQVILETDGTWKVAYFTIPDGKSILLFTADHTIVDGMSLFIITNDFCRDNLGTEEEDRLIDHRNRQLLSAKVIPAEINDYYFGKAPLKPYIINKNIGNEKYVTATIALSEEETKMLTKRALNMGIMPYTYIQYGYVSVLQRMLDKSEFWLMTSESGRYADWEGDLDIAGNLTLLIPIRIEKGMDINMFQEILTKLRDWPGLSETDLINTGIWNEFHEGIISNDFVQTDPLVEDMILVGGGNRGGNSMTMRNGRLIIELRHLDNEEERQKYEKMKGMLEKWLREEGTI